MTIGDAVARLDELKPNTVSYQRKVEWLADVDWDIYRTLVKTHEGGEDLVFEGYDVQKMSNPYEVTLLAVKPYDRMYVQYMMAQIDLQNQEYDLYANDAALYNQSRDEYAKYYNRKVMPVQGRGLHAETWDGGETKCICPALNL